MLPDPPNFELVRCAVYTRQSVVPPGEDPALTSCSLQRTMCTEFIRSMAWRGWYPIGEHFDDVGYSGANLKRPGLDQLFARIEEGDIERVIVYRLDRLTRKLTDWALLAGLFERFNVGLTVVHGAIDAEAGSLARLQLNMLATFAELERDMIHERLADARATRKARGERAAGRVPRGYTTDPRTKQLIVVEREAAVVRWFFAEADAGKKTGEMIAKATQLGLTVKSGERTEWTSRAVLRLLQNPTYAGRRPDGAPATHTPLIPSGLFDRVQLAITSRRARPHTRRSRFDERHDPFFLRGLLVCERCGKTMTTSMSVALTKKSAKKAPRYYRCRTESCRGGQVAAAEVEAVAFDALRTPRPNWSATTLERSRELSCVWDVMWPMFRRLALASFFETMMWRARTRQLRVQVRAHPLDATIEQGAE